jgi:hypothetical protein
VHFAFFFRPIHLIPSGSIARALFIGPLVDATVT